MGWLARLTGREAKSGPTVEELLREMFGRPPSKSGVEVTISTALQVSTVLACARVRANGVAQVPLKVYRELPGGGSEPARDHSLFEVLRLRPNPWQTSFELRQMMEFHRTLCGNAYAFINRVRGSIVELIPFEPGQVAVKRNDDYSLAYTVTAPNGRQMTFPSEAILHLRGPSWNGWMGLDTVKLAREAIGLAIATEEAHAKLHKNGVQTSGLYSVEGTLNKAQYDALREWIEQNHAGAANSGRPFILDRAAKWTSLAMSGVDAEHLATRRHQVEEICRALNVFPQMVGYSDKASTYASAEQFFGAHVVHTLGPEYVAWEQALDCSLLGERERRDGLFCKFTVNGLLRGAMKDRAEFYTKLYGVGALSPNDIRALEDMNPYEGGEAYRVPLNMVDPAQEPPPPADPAPNP